jgi:hypothetical protein
VIDNPKFIQIKFFFCCHIDYEVIKLTKFLL